MSTINSWIKRNPLITALLCILAVVALVGFISVRTNSFNDPQDLFTRDLNPDNLLKPGEDGNYTLTSAKRTNEGLTVTPNNNGSIEITGTNMAYIDGDYNEIDVAVLTLEAGTYTLSSGYANASTATVCLVAEYGEEVVYQIKYTITIVGTIIGAWLVVMNV